MTGRALGHYEILEKLGEGGMGVVYRARDTHLDRPVAIKVLRPDAVSNPERKRRFVQEAKAASALNHPNIITIYDIDLVDGVDYIAMEYVAGQAMDHLLAGRALRAPEALEYAAQIAGALAAAHVAGIVHRDLKPANLMVTELGLVKVLDFGLAKLIEPTADSDATETVYHAAHTEEGAILGTVAYMSPEQAEGRKIDSRSDIFSFGSVLYEMLAGRRAFHGETRMSTLSSILNKEPQPVSQIAPDAPRELERIVALCMRKDPRRRFQHMDDVKVALEALRDEPLSAGGDERPAAAPAPRRPALPATIAAAVALAAVASGLTWWLTRPGPAPPGPVLKRLTSNPGLNIDPTLSPDGKLVAYASDRSGKANLDIWVQPVAGGQAIQLTSHDADDHQPSFSPDGNRIAFRSDRDGGGVYVMSMLGGEARRIADEGRRPRFSPDGSQVAYWVGFAGVGDASAAGALKMFLVASAGGPPRQLQPDFNSAGFPVWSPDGKRILFFGAVRPALGSYDWWITPVEEGAAIQTGAFAAFARQGITLPTGPPDVLPAQWLSQDDAVVFAASGGQSANLWQVALPPGAGRVSGPPRRLTMGSDFQISPSAAGSGLLSFSSLDENIDIWSLPVDANQGKVTGALQRLTDDALPDTYPSLSTDGRRLVFQSPRSGNQDIWIKLLETGQESAMTADPAEDWDPAISADGSTLAFGRRQATTAPVYAQAVAPGRAPAAAQKLCEDCRIPWALSSDGKKLLFWISGPPRRIGLMDVASRQQTELIRHSSYGLYRPQFSPDNRWIGFEARIGPGRARIYIVPFRNGTPTPPESEWIAVTPGESWDTLPRWSPDGRLLYFTSERDQFRCIWAQRLDPATTRPLGDPFAVYHAHNPRLSLTNVNFSDLELAVARDKLVFVMSKRSASIWTADFSRLHVR